MLNMMIVSLIFHSSWPAGRTCSHSLETPLIIFPDGRFLESVPSECHSVALGEASSRYAMPCDWTSTICNDDWPYSIQCDQLRCKFASLGWLFQFDGKWGELWSQTTWVQASNHLELRNNLITVRPTHRKWITTWHDLWLEQNTTQQLAIRCPWRVSVRDVWSSQHFHASWSAVNWVRIRHFVCITSGSWQSSALFDQKWPDSNTLFPQRILVLAWW
jgi:hypothetical protein